MYECKSVERKWHTKYWRRNEYYYYYCYYWRTQQQNTAIKGKKVNKIHKIKSNRKCYSSNSNNGDDDDDGTHSHTHNDFLSFFFLLFGWCGKILYFICSSRSFGFVKTMESTRAMNKHTHTHRQPKKKKITEIQCEIHTAAVSVLVTNSSSSLSQFFFYFFWFTFLFIYLELVTLCCEMFVVFLTLYSLHSSMSRFAFLHTQTLDISLDNLSFIHFTFLFHLFSTISFFCLFGFE